MATGHRVRRYDSSSARERLPEALWYCYQRNVRVSEGVKVRFQFCIERQLSPTPTAWRPALFCVFLVSSLCRWLGLLFSCGAVFLPLRFRFVPLPLRRTHPECVRCDGPPPCRSVSFSFAPRLRDQASTRTWTTRLGSRSTHDGCCVSFCRYDHIALPVVADLP